MPTGAAQRVLSRNNGERFLAPGYACVSRPIGSVAGTTQYFLRETAYGKKETIDYGGMEKSARTLPKTWYT